MDLLVNYSASDDEDASPPPQPVPSLLPARLQVAAAPPVDTTGLALSDGQLVAAASGQARVPGQKNVYYNPTADELFAPVVGPQERHSKGDVNRGVRNHRSGHVESAHVSSFAFEQQYHTFHTAGFAADPNAAAGLAGDAQAARAHNFDTLAALNPPKRQRTAEDREKERQKKEALAAAAASYDPNERWTIQNKGRNWQHLPEKELCGLSEEDQAKVRAALGQDEPDAAGPREEKSFFHGKEQEDYLGRSWLEAPKGLKSTVEGQGCYLPKKLAGTFAGHQKGVQVIRFFPGTGHLLLTGGLDGKVKIWDVVGTPGKCMRSYLGHEKGVRDLTFSNDGRRFVSSSFDKTIKIWDTETGKVIRSITAPRVCYVVKLHPDEDKQDQLLAGCGDRRIYQYDLNTGDVVQQYDRHLDAVNTITFVQDNKNFVTTSDDKTIRVWEFGVPEQIKYLADPSMHSMPAVGLHPNGKWMLMQSMDNQVLTYGCRDRFSANRKKVFKGHNSAGFACGVGVSPDGKYVYSGDGEGRAFFWDWKTCKIARTVRAHEGAPCIGIEWHPLETSKVVTCSYGDPVVKMWD